MAEAIEVRSPFDGAVIGEVPKLSADDVDSAVLSAKATLRNHIPAWRRAEILYDASLAASERREDLARIIATEAAKPIATARLEAARAVSTLGWSSLAARRLAGEVLPMEGSMVGEGKLAYTTRVPVGVVGAISPFNFPLNLVCHKVGPAIAAGCPIVLKPASQTPFSAFALAEILRECGLPDGYLTVVTGSGAEVGNAIVEHPDVAFISFTGSADVGWTLNQKAARKRVCLELGNSTPIIVAADSDWEEAVERIAAGGYSHAGQSCISVQRAYVQREIASQFTEALVSRVEQLVTGDPMAEDTNVSALITESDRDRVKSWIDEAIGQGATLLCGGEIEGSVLTPTVLDDVTLDMKVASEEVFGPVVGVQTFGDLDEAINLANGTRYGLQAAIYTSNINEAMRATRELDFGAVLVNESPTWRADLMPYGGVKDSGNTREGPDYATWEMTERRLVVINS